MSSSIGFRSGIQAGQPVSLPPILNGTELLPITGNSGGHVTSGPTSLTSGYSSMSSRLGTASSSSSNLTPRSSSNMKIDGKVSVIWKDMDNLHGLTQISTAYHRFRANPCKLNSIYELNAIPLSAITHASIVFKYESWRKSKFDIKGKGLDNIHRLAWISTAHHRFRANPCKMNSMQYH